MTSKVWMAAAAALGLLLIGATAFNQSQPRTSATPPAPFVEVAGDAGLDFSPGLPEGLLNIREIAGSGCGFLDYDQDGWLDIVLLGWDHTALYRGEGGRFRDVTAEVGLPQKGQWIGVAAADYDNDGFPDLFLSGYGCAALLRNDQGRRFRDVTVEAGLRQASEPTLFATGGIWGDYDRDGRLDLYVPRYVHFQEGMVEHCKASSGSLETCNPDHYRAQTGSLYRNLGDRFVDVTRATGADKVTGKCWGGVFFDPDDDGWPDLYLSNDEVACDFLRNVGGKRFENLGRRSGLAFDADGRTHAAMGSEVGDYDRDGRLDLVVTAFSNEVFSVYRNNGDGSFTDRSVLTGIGMPTLPMVGWGVRLLDFDLNGWEDLFFANGHATDSAAYGEDRTRMSQPPQLFRNVGGHFEAVPVPALEKPLLGRGVASGDYDNDGDEDLLVSDSAGKVRLLRNEQKGAAQWIGFRLTGTESNRDALGARVTVNSGTAQWVAEVRTGGSLFSTHDPRLIVGLGSNRPDRVTVRWPSGRTTRIENPEPGRYHSLAEREATRAAGPGSG